MRNLLIIIFLFIYAIASATNYYVSSAGNDANNGLSSTTSWKTIAKVNSTSFSPGDIIYFNKGEIWRETLTIPSSGSSGANITFSSYGTGVDPIISGSDLDISWSRYTANIWQSTVTTQPTIVYFNNKRGTLRANSSCSAEYEWYWAGNILYVYSPSDNNPSITYNSPGVEVGNRSRALQTNNKEYITFNHIVFRDGNSLTQPCVNVGSTTVVGFIMQYCTIERSTHNGILLEDSGPSGVSAIIDHCTINDNGAYGIVAGYQFNTISISNNIISNNGWGSVRDGAPASGIAGNLGNADIFGNTIYGNGPSPSYDPSQSHGIYVSSASTQAANIHNNIIYGQLNGSGIKARYSSNIHHNHIYGNNSHGIEFGGNDATSVTYNIYYNLIHGTITGNAAGLTNGLNGTAHVVFENNTCYKNGVNSSEFTTTVDVPYLTVKNNIFYAFDGRRGMDLATETGVTDIDYNLYWQDSQNGNPNFKYNNTYPSWSGWKASGFDAHGINADPLFVSTSDFHLKTGSPAISKGLTISGLTTDFAGNSVKSPPSIGAYDNGTAAAPAELPIIQTSVVENATSSVLELTYNLSLSSSIVPVVSSYSVLVNGVARTINAIIISGTKVQLTLSNAIKYGDIITASYTLPATNPLQTTSAGIAASFSLRAVTNNLVSPAKDALPVTISMTISPTHVYKTISVILKYSSVLTTTQTTAITPEILRIIDASGKLFVEKFLVTGTTSTKILLNLNHGIYNVLILANGVQAASSKIMIY